MDISLRSLRHVLMLARTRHFGRAAEELGISQPALTRSIQSLESELGVILFDRQGRDGIEPTTFGKMICEKGRDILLDSEELWREIELVQGLETGELSVSCGLYPAELSAAKAVGRLMAKHSNLRCRFRITDWRQATSDVLNRHADVAVAEISEAEKTPELQVELVATHPMIYFCRHGHPILKKKSLNLVDLMEYPWIATRAPQRILSVFPKFLNRSGWVDPVNGDFVPAVVVDDLTSAKQSVSMCDGISAAPIGLLKRDIDSRVLCKVPFDPPWLRLRYGFIYLKNRSLSPSAKFLIDEIRSVEKELNSEGSVHR
ncbi:MAG: LysR family transcriptional regulator [Planctomycetes bacterium]|nr:LysR family transcriptional regulator [Planctomycetota bacterium]